MDILAAQLAVSMMDKLNGKNVVFIGDSVMAGSGWRAQDGITEPTTVADTVMAVNLRGWPKVIKDKHPGCNIYNLALYGSSVAFRSNEPCWYNQLTYLSTMEVTPDIVVFEGGGIDVVEALTVGTVSSDYAIFTGTEYNATQVIPCLEATISKIINDFPSARLVYVIDPKIYIDSSTTITSIESLHTLIKQVCNKWGVKVVDMYNECQIHSRNNTYSNNTNYYTAADKMHPLRRAYEESAYMIENAIS